MPEQDFPNGNGEARPGVDAGAAAFGDTMREAEDYVRRQWRDNPIGVAAIVAGVGIVIGLLLGRRR